MPAKKTTTEIAPVSMKFGVLDACILGASPLIYNAMSGKAQRQLLLPSGRKTAAEKAQTVKHNPLEEYRNSVYRARKGDNSPTELRFPSPCFKQAMMTAGLEIPGMTKAKIGRLIWVESYDVAMYGTPFLLMSGVRSADMNRTPDIRTRAILPEWCCKITIRFTEPTLNPKVIGDLLAVAGMLSGVGDWRQQKGSGNYGQFRVVDEADETFRRVMTTQARALQQAAIENPEPFDGTSEELLSWWHEEIERRGQGEMVAAA